MLIQSGTAMVEGGAALSRNMTAGTALLKTGAGYLDAIVVNSHTNGSIVIVNGTTANGSQMHGTIAFASGERYIPFFGEGFATGLFVTVGGTANVTLIYR